MSGQQVLLAAMPSLNQLRTLAAGLPPNFVVNPHEVPQVLSALVAAYEHGDELVQAAEQGAEAIADYYHDRAVEQAREAGTEEPTRGARPPATQAPQPTVQQAGTGVSAQEAARLIQEIQSLRAEVANARRPDQAQATASESAPSDPAEHEFTEPASVTELPSGVSVANLSDEQALALEQALKDRSRA